MHYIKIIDGSTYFSERANEGYIAVANLPVNFNSNKKYTLANNQIIEESEIEQPAKELAKLRNETNQLLNSIFLESINAGEYFEFYNITMPITKKKIDELLQLLLIKNNKSDKNSNEIIVYDIENKPKTLNDIKFLENIIEELYSLLLSITAKKEITQNSINKANTLEELQEIKNSISEIYKK